MHWWCLKCQTWAINDKDDPHVQFHKDEVVGIRQDILNDSMKRVVWELKVTDRLVKLH